MTDKMTDKMARLYELWLSGQSQMAPSIKVVHFARLDGGDLAHLGDAMLAGHKILVTSKQASKQGKFECFNVDSFVFGPEMYGIEIVEQVDLWEVKK